MTEKKEQEIEKQPLDKIAELLWGQTVVPMEWGDCVALALNIYDAGYCLIPELKGLSEEEIYELNEADTELRRHLFWETGVLDTCKAVSQATLDSIKKQLGVE